MLARKQPGEAYAATIKLFKSARIDKMTAEELDAAEQALSLTSYSGWVESAADRVLLVVGEAACKIGENYGRPPANREAVLSQLTGDAMLKDDIASVIGLQMLSIPAPIRIALSVAADVAIGYSKPAP